MPHAESDILRWKLYGAEASEAAIVVHAPDTSILWSNPKAAQLLGIARDELTGKLAADPSFKLLDESGRDLPFSRYPVVMALKTADKVADLVVGTRKDGSDRITWGQISAYPVTEEGELKAVVVTFVDITQRVEAEEARRRVAAQLEATARLESLAVLAGGVAHDFNNLLVGILGAADTARDLLHEPNEVAGMLELIIDSAHRASELTQQLMAYAGRAPVVTQVLDANEVVRELTRLVRGSLPTQTEVEVDLAPTPLPVEVDATQLRQVVMNLIINAAESSDTEASRVTVRTRMRSLSAPDLPPDFEAQAGAYVLIEVEDRGQGMDEATCRRIFEPFFTTKPSGHGLGLAAVHGMVRSHGGFVRVASEPGQGTRFELGLPRSGLPVAETGPDEENAEAGPARRALLVDDEPQVRRIVGKMLSIEGFEVVELEDGSDFFAHLERHLPHLVVLDVTLPGDSGLSLLERLRSRHPDLPVLLCSGHTDAKVRLEPDTPTVFLAKPFRRAQLREAIAELM